MRRVCVVFHPKVNIKGKEKNLTGFSWRIFSQRSSSIEHYFLLKHFSCFTKSQGKKLYSFTTLTRDFPVPRQIAHFTSIDINYMMNGISKQPLALIFTGSLALSSWHHSFSTMERLLSDTSKFYVIFASKMGLCILRETGAICGEWRVSSSSGVFHSCKLNWNLWTSTTDFK